MKLIYVNRYVSCALFVVKLASFHSQNIFGIDKIVKKRTNILLVSYFEWDNLIMTSFFNDIIIN